MNDNSTTLDLAKLAELRRLLTDSVLPDGHIEDCACAVCWACHQASGDLVETLDPVLPALLDAAERLAELQSALEFLHDQSGLGVTNNSLYPEELLSIAAERGWTGERNGGQQ